MKILYIRLFFNHAKKRIRAGFAKRRYLPFVFLNLLLILACEYSKGNNSSDLTLWYKQPAEKWIETLPIGNGTLGAVIFGGILQEKLGLNISTFWSGEPSDKNVKPGAAANLEEIRKAFFEGELGMAEKLCEMHLIGNKENYGTHLPFGNLIFDFNLNNQPTSNYTRKLELKNALATVQFSQGGTDFKREMFASNPDNVIAVKLSTTQNKLHLKIHFDGQGLPLKTKKISNTIFGIEGNAFENIHSNGEIGVHAFAGITVANCDGNWKITDAGIEVEQANEIVLLIASNTNYDHQNPVKTSLDQLERAGKKTFLELKNRHIADYQNLFQRVKLELGNDETNNLPTDERIKILENPSGDPQLYALFYNYARYLLIAGSREASPLPLNLQGIWNDNFACNMPWTCDFHLDINTQQNYWLAESGNLSECHEPLFKLIKGLVEPGKKTAKNLYGEEGWVAHVFTNAWGFTAPGWGLGWGLHTTGGIWIVSHLWNHYEYTLNKDFLRERAYPVLKEAAIFFDGYLTQHPEKTWLVSGPSISPENKYFDKNGNIFSETMGASCDAVLIRDLFESCIKAGEILCVDEDFRKNLIEKKSKLQPLSIGKHGQLQEWLEDYEDAVPNHRHTTHLISLYPGSQITPSKTPELALAAQTTIERRLNQPNWEDVEWSRGNFINFYARLQNADEALKHLHGLIKENASISMLTFSRGGIAGAEQDIFSIDGNFAGASGISEMLVQSYDDEIFLLPALPVS